MSRKQFLAELGQYLTFVSPEQRDEIVAYYDALLENAGPNGEARTLEEIGTPMKVAIALKRRLEANEPLIPEISDKIDTPYFVKCRRRGAKEEDNTNESEEKQDVALESTPAASEANEGTFPTEEESRSKAVVETEETTESEAAAEAEDATVSEAAAEAEDVTVSEAAVKAEDATVSEAAVEAEDAIVSEAAAESEDSAESEAAAEAEEVAEIEAAAETEDIAASKSMPEAKDEPKSEKSASAALKTSISLESTETSAKPPMTFGRFMTAVGIALASIVIVAFFAVITAIGGVIIASAVDIVISGFDPINYLSDRLMILGCGALIAAIGILLIWFAVWAAIRLIKSMVRSFNKTVPPEKNTLKTIWKVIWITVLVFVVIAVICGGVSLFMGGDPTILSDNEAFSGMLSKLGPTAFVNIFKNSGLFG